MIRSFDNVKVDFVDDSKSYALGINCLLVASLQAGLITTSFAEWQGARLQTIAMKLVTMTWTNFSYFWIRRSDVVVWIERSPI